MDIHTVHGRATAEGGIFFLVGPAVGGRPDDSVAARA